MSIQVVFSIEEKHVIETPFFPRESDAHFVAGGIDQISPTQWEWGSWGTTEINIFKIPWEDAM